MCFENQTLALNFLTKILSLRISNGITLSLPIDHESHFFRRLLRSRNKMYFSVNLKHCLAPCSITGNTIVHIEDNITYEQIILMYSNSVFFFVFCFVSLLFGIPIFTKKRKKERKIGWCGRENPTLCSPLSHIWNHQRFYLFMKSIVFSLLISLSYFLYGVKCFVVLLLVNAFVSFIIPFGIVYLSIFYCHRLITSNVHIVFSLFRSYLLFYSN